MTTLRLSLAPGALIENLIGAYRVISFLMSVGHGNYSWLPTSCMYTTRMPGMPTLTSPTFDMEGFTTKSTLDGTVKVMSLENVPLGRFQTPTSWAAEESSHGRRRKTLFFEEVRPRVTRCIRTGQNGEISIPRCLSFKFKLMRDKITIAIQKSVKLFSRSSSHQCRQSLRDFASLLFIDADIHREGWMLT